jgi:hypothetical protein
VILKLGLQRDRHAIFTSKRLPNISSLIKYFLTSTRLNIVNINFTFNFNWNLIYLNKSTTNITQPSSPTTKSYSHRWSLALLHLRSNANQSKKSLCLSVYLKDR